MKLYYYGSRIEHVVWYKDYNSFENPSNRTLDVLEIDEDVNEELCRDLVKYAGLFNRDKVDVNGDTKYYMDSDELHVVDDWVQLEEDIYE